MARIDRLAPYMHQVRRQQDAHSPLSERPEGPCVGCEAHITHVGNYNPIDAVLHDGALVCTFCLIQLLQAEHYGWHRATAATVLPTLWNPWPPDDDQLAWIWDGHTYWDARATYQGPRR